MGDVVVWLVDNGDYWKAAWREPSTGRLRSMSLGAKAKVSNRAATVRCRQLAADLSRQKRLAGVAPALSEWLNRYYALRSDVKKSTRSTYTECGMYLLAHFTADPTIDRISRADAAAWQVAMASGKLAEKLNAERRKRLAAELETAKGEEVRQNLRRRTKGDVYAAPTLSTVRRHVRVAKQIFGEAARQDLILFNPFDRLIGAAPKLAKAWREVTDADMRMIFDACPDEPWRMLFALCRYAALRRGEALRLAWGDIQWDKNRLTVNADVELETTKQAMRVCPIEPARCPTGLTRMLRNCFDAASPGARGPCDGVDAGNIDLKARRILRRSAVGVYEKPFHTLRKCRISELALHYPQGVLEDWCGHDEEISRRHYQRVPDELYQPPPEIGHDFGRNGGPTQSETNPAPVQRERTNPGNHSK